MDKAEEANKNKRTNLINLAIMLAAIIIALIIYAWRRPKDVVNPKSLPVKQKGAIADTTKRSH